MTGSSSSPSLQPGTSLLVPDNHGPGTSGEPSVGAGTRPEASGCVTPRFHLELFAAKRPPLSPFPFVFRNLVSLRRVKFVGRPMLTPSRNAFLTSPAPREQPLRPQSPGSSSLGPPASTFR